MYYFANFFCARKRDFIVENSKKKAIGKGSTGASTGTAKTKKATEIMDEFDDKPQKTSDNSTENKSPISSYQIESSVNPTESVPLTASNIESTPPQDTINEAELSLDVEIEDDDVEVDEKEILKDIQNL